MDARRFGPRRRLLRRTAVACAVVAFAVAGVAACTRSARSAGPGPTVAQLPAGPYASRPNIVFVLTDDLATNLDRFMPHVLALQRSGMTFDNYVVSDSLCCPSRASILTGEFPHDTGIYTNSGSDGGYLEFHRRHEEEDTYGLALQRGGYRTALLGKYLNEYPVGTPLLTNQPGPRVAGGREPPPQGWSTWFGVDFGYPEYDYNVNDDGLAVHYGARPQDYLTDVLARRGDDFVRWAAAARKPFVAEVATFAPHNPFVPAPRDVGTFPHQSAPRGPSFDRQPRNAPRWLARLPVLQRDQLRTLNTVWRLRVESVQAVDRMIGSLEDTLRATHQLRNTIFVFSSDNGFHLGDHGLLRGKLTAFDTDIRVPLIVSGPGIPAGSVNDDIVQNVDLAPTFDELAGVPVPPAVDGRSLVPLLHGGHPAWRQVALVEHHGPAVAASDPDRQTADDGNPPSYTALRTASYAYVDYYDGEREYYDLRTDPAENDNVYGSLDAATRRALDARVAAMRTCHGSGCWTAAEPR